MKISYLLLFMITLLFTNSVTNTEENSQEEINPSKINIIGTYYGGCGFAANKKKRILEEIKRTLTKKFAFNDEMIVAKTLDLKAFSNTNIFKIPDLNINFNEFNIFLFYKKNKFLVGTSSRELKEYFYSYLAGVVGADTNYFYEDFAQRVYKLLKEVDMNEAEM